MKRVILIFMFLADTCFMGVEMIVFEFSLHYVGHCDPNREFLGK